MKKRIIILLLILSILAVFAACGDKAAPVDTPAPEAPAPEEAAPAAPEPEEAAEEEILPEEPSRDPEQEEPEAPVTVDLDQVRTAMMDHLEIADPFLLDTDALLNLYGIDSAWVAQSASFVTMSGTFPDEVILTEAVDADAAASIAQCLQNRLDEVLVQSKSYDAENYAAAQACQVRTDGLYVCLLLSPKQAEMAEIYQSLIQD